MIQIDLIPETTPVTACGVCGAFKATCLVTEFSDTHGSCTAHLCCYCVHDKQEHGRSFFEELNDRADYHPGESCDCSREAIYPAWMLAAIDETRGAGRTVQDILDQYRPRR